MRSKIGPDVSDRSNFSRSAQPWLVSGSITRISACGFSAMLRRLLLKNWNDSATCVAIDVVDVAQERGVRRAVLRAREEHRRQDALEARRQLFEAEAHDSTAPASGPGVWLNTAVTRILTATHGHICHVLVEVSAGQANHVELAQERLPLAKHERLLGRLGVARRNEHAFDLDGAIVRRPRERQRGLAVAPQIVEDRRRGGRRQIGNKVRGPGPPPSPP